jgi:hypothetical protein
MYQEIDSVSCVRATCTFVVFVAAFDQHFSIASMGR